MEFTDGQITALRARLDDPRAYESDAPTYLAETLLALLAGDPDGVCSRGSAGLVDGQIEWEVYATRGSALASVRSKGSVLTTWVIPLSEVQEISLLGANPGASGDRLGWRGDWQLTIREREPLKFLGGHDHGLLEAVQAHLVDRAGS